MNGNIKAETQPWFEEGFAEYFATTVVDNHVAKVGFKPPPGDLEVLQQYSWLHLADLFAVRHDSQTYNEGDRRSVFYAESWLVVYYLQATQQFSKLNAYFTAVMERKVPIPDAIQQAFGISAVQFEKGAPQIPEHGPWSVLPDSFATRNRKHWIHGHPD
jgi:hypothetical protein